MPDEIDALLAAYAAIPEPERVVNTNPPPPPRPLLVHDGKYAFLHDGGRWVGPFNACFDIDGQILDPAYNAKDPHGVRVNPRECRGGRAHKVENPLCPPKELLRRLEQE